jgi:hypothetical protein
MFFTPQEVRPSSPGVALGLVLSIHDIEETGTTRQGRPEYRLLRRVWYKDFEVPAGFIFDVHSLPRLLRFWQPRNPAWWGPPALHDWALESGLISIKEANELYRSAMEDLGVRPIHRFAAYRGVEIGRRFFPDRITRIDPDNADLVEQIAGREAVYHERNAGVRRVLFKAAKFAATGYLRSRGVTLL